MGMYIIKGEWGLIRETNPLNGLSMNFYLWESYAFLMGKMDSVDMMETTA